MLSAKLGWRTTIAIVKYCCKNATQSKKVNFNSKYRKYFFCNWYVGIPGSI